LQQQAGERIMADAEGYHVELAMTACPWLNEHGFTAEGVRRFIGHHLVPCATNAAGCAETALEELREEVRAKPHKVLVIAGLAGFVLGLTLAAARRGADRS
jgi:hypothetical protein